MNTKNQKKVTIIVPIYNAEKTLEKCITSILNQTYDNLEIILINDGSNDNSEQIIKKYKDKRIVYIKNKNKGVSATRNEGIEISTGEFILFVDSDDYLDDSMVQKLMEHKNQFVICSYHEVDSKNVIHNFATEEKAKVMNLKRDFWFLYENKQAINRPWGKLYKTSIIKEKRIQFNPNISLGEDLLFNLEYMKNIDDLVFLDQGLYYYKIGNSNSLAKKYYSNMLDIQEILKEKFLEFTEQLNLPYKIKKKVYIKSLRFLLSATTNELHSNKKNKLSNMRRIMNHYIIQEYTKYLYEEKIITYLQYKIIQQKHIIIYLFFRNILFK